MSEEIVDPKWDKEFNEFWLPLITTERQLDIEKIKNELHDYAFILEQVPKVYMHVTSDRLSKANYHADTIISEHDDICHETCKADLEETEENYSQELQLLENKISDLDRLANQCCKDLKQTCATTDIEVNHSNADKLIMQFLTTAGFKKLAKRFDSLKKWYG